MPSQTDIQKLITRRQRRLQKLKEKEATFGVSAPPEVLMEIEDIEAAISALQTELEAEQVQLQQTLNNLPGLNLPGAADFQQQIKERLADIEQHLKALSETAPRFDQRNQQVGTQYNIAGGFTQHVAPPPAADPADLETSYLNHVFEQCSPLNLQMIDRAAAAKVKASLTLSRVYTALLTMSREEHQKWQEEGMLERDASLLSAVNQLNQHQHLVLLGEPGSGKSTFVNFIAMCLAGERLNKADANLERLAAPLPDEEGNAQDERQPWERGFLLPLRVILRDFAATGLPPEGERAGAQHLWEFIGAELTAATLGDYRSHLKTRLRKTGGLILLDGLDEVPEASKRRAQIKQAVEDFKAAFPRCRILVTSRTYAYQKQEWQLKGFNAAVLSPFSQGQIRQFVDRWYAYVAILRGEKAESAPGKAELLKQAIFSNARLREFAERPLLLTLMASLHAWRGGSLPDRREQLYREAVDLLLDLWESARVIQKGDKIIPLQPSLQAWLKIKDKDNIRHFLDQLAYKAHDSQPDLVGTANIDGGELARGLLKLGETEEDLNPNKLLDYLSQRAGLLVSRGQGVYAFPHRTFQEYLAACYLTDEDDFPDNIAELARREPNRWREVALLAGAKAASGSAPMAWLLVEALCGEDLSENPAPEDIWGAHLAAQVVVESANLTNIGKSNRRKVERVKTWLKYILSDPALSAAERALAGKSLAVLGDDRDLDQLIPIPAGPFLMGDDGESDAGPRHTLTLPEYRIGKYPVANAQYARFVEATGRRWEDADFPPEKANSPARYVAWYDARAYCAWLTEIWRGEGKINAREEVRLPTEAEWEKAASWNGETRRQGDKGRVGRKRRYPWGDEWDKTKCNTTELGLGEACAVGMFPQGASPYGCLDMAGNVFEWTLSLWGKEVMTPEFKYPYNPTDGRENLEADDDWLRVVRGGAFDYLQGYARCAFRYWDLPGISWDDYGFRVLVSPIFSPSAL